MVCRGRVLAVDYGEKNIGLACTDALRLTVRPMPSIPNRGRRDFLKRLQAAIREMEVRELVLGIPWNMDGSRGDAAQQMERLVGYLASVLKIPITGVDERLSTAEALEFWQGMSPKKQKKYKTVDSLAAALILERHLKEGEP